MKRSLTALGYCSCFIALLSVVQAIPISRPGTESSKAANEAQSDNACVHENGIYSAGENFSTSNPCEICVCDPPAFSCKLVSCDLKPGCKAIHRANSCCPEYVCECERNGKIYGNGEKVEEPNPCKVCYCKGGEIKCAPVSCYTRDDCEPGYVAGVCCPKYDHCPPLDMMKNKSTTPAPAQVIISDLKTESTPTLLQEDDKTTVPDVEDEATEPTTSEEYSESESTTKKEPPFEFRKPELSEIYSYSRNSSSTEVSETDYDGYTEINRTTETSNETEYTTIVTEPETDNSTSNKTTEDYDDDFIGTGKYNVTETVTTISLHITTEWMEEYEDETDDDDLSTEFENEEYDDLSTESENITESTTMDPEVSPEAVTYTTFTTTDSYGETEDLSPTQSHVSTTVTTGAENTGSFTFTPPTYFEDSETVTVTVELPTEARTEEPSEETSKNTVVKVIIPKTMKEDVDQIQNAADGTEPIVVMISADQIQFLKLAEEPPVYVENPDEEDQKPENDHMGVMVVPKTTPTTVEMVKVVDESVNATMESAKPENISLSSNSTE